MEYLPTGMKKLSVMEEQRARCVTELGVACQEDLQQDGRWKEDGRTATAGYSDISYLTQTGLNLEPKKRNINLRPHLKLCT